MKRYQRLLIVGLINSFLAVIVYGLLMHNKDMSTLSGWVVFAACLSNLYWYLQWKDPQPATPGFAAGQTVRLVRMTDCPAAYQSQMPLTGTIQPMQERDIRLGTVAVKFTVSKYIYHVPPGSLEAVVTEI